MYQIVSNGRTVGLCDTPRWVAPKGEFGCFVAVDEKEATHVAVGGAAYSLAETDVRKVDGAELVFLNNGRLEIVEVESADTQDALCAFSGDVESRIGDIEDALCELSR